MDISLNEDRVKSMAARLRLASGPRTLSASKSLEVLASVLGYPNWDTLSGLLKRQRQPGVRLPESVELYLPAFALYEYGESPSFARVKVTQKWIEELLELQATCVSKQLSHIAIDGGPDEWQDDEHYRMRSELLVVDSSSFWFQAHPKHANYLVETREVGVEQLLTALNLRKETGELLWHEKCLVNDSTLLSELLDREILKAVDEESDTDHE